jgi:hypothetical protein
VRVLPVLAVCALGLNAALEAAPQQPDQVPAMAIERLREELEKPPPPRLQPKTPVPLRPTFRSRVEGRPWVPTLEEHLHQEFDLTPLQRQSAEWRSRCCGFNLGLIFEHIEKVRREREIRKIRAQIAHEVSVIEATRKHNDVK